MEMPALEGTRVAAGQVVARIDDRVAKLRADALRAQIEGVRAERARLRAERRLNQNQADAQMRTRTSTVTAREKALAALKSDLDLARLELERNWSLFERRVAGERQLQQSQAAVTKLESQILQLQAEHEQAEGSLDEARVELDKLGVIDAQIAALDHQVANLAAQLAQQNVDIEDRTIRSPVPAVIDRTFVLPGEYVAGRPAHPAAAQSQRGLGRGQHQGDPGRPAEARPEGASSRSTPIPTTPSSAASRASAARPPRASRCCRRPILRAISPRSPSVCRSRSTSSIRPSR